MAISSIASPGVNLPKASVSVTENGCSAATAVTEGGANDSFTVVLSNPPDGSNVVVVDVTGNSDVEIDKERRRATPPEPNRLHSTAPTGMPADCQRARL